MPLRVLIVLALALLAGCQTKPPDPSEDLRLRTLTLPGGQQIRAEILVRPEEVMRGMMFRPGLAENRGLLFIHRRTGKYSYWMHNVAVPLDIIWMDKDRTIVEIAVNTPPCKEADPIKCPQYGGNQEARFVLEIAGGLAAKFGLSVGQRIQF
jgi:uncharacterized protein